MSKKERTYYVVTQNAIPEVLLKVVEVKQLLESGGASSVQMATEMAGISRSSFYKYRDDIFEFRENARGKTITFLLEMRDEPGLLADVLRVVAEYHANILTIHQAIPSGGIASTSMSVEVTPAAGDIAQMMRQIEKTEGVRSLRILGSDLP